MRFHDRATNRSFDKYNNHVSYESENGDAYRAISVLASLK